MEADLPLNEADRLRALRRYAILDTEPEKEFDDLTALAAYICQTPIAQITLIDKDRQWFKSNYGGHSRQDPRAVSFCAHAILDQERLLVVEDALADERFASNPLVAGEPNIRFYAGAPLVTPDGFALGSLCAIDTRARQLTAEQQQALSTLARVVMGRMEQRHQQQRQTSLLAAALENTEDGVLILDARQPGWPIRFCNRSFEALTGYSQAEVAGQPLRFLIGLVEDTAAIGELNAALRQERACRLVVEATRRDGARFWNELDLSPISGDDGRVTHFVGIMRDISERQQAEAALQASEAFSRSILNSVTSHIAVIDRDGTILAVNDAWQRFGQANGQPPGSAVNVGASYLAIVEAAAQQDGSQSEVLAGLRSVLSGASNYFECEYPCDSPTEQRWFSMHVTPLAGGQGGAVVSHEDISALKLASQALEQQLQRLGALRQIDEAIISSLDLTHTLDVFVTQAAEQLGADAMAVLLLNPASGLLEYAGGRGFRPDSVVHMPLTMQQALGGRAMLERQMVHVPELAAEPHFTRRALTEQEGLHEYFGVPLIAKGKVLGALEIFQRQPSEPQAGWLRYLHTLANQAAISLDSARLFSDVQRGSRELKQAYDSTIEGWSRALDLRDRETEGHSLRVTQMTLRLAEHMGYGGEALLQMRRGALLHDIGKMGVPDAILLKPGPLSADEWVEMRKHPANAYALLYPIEYLRQALDIPYAHHEKWDGSGYPRGLRGEAIPMAARLFAIVDVWDALRSDRPYRAAWPAEKVNAHLLGLAGTHFDPQVTEAFLNLIAIHPGTSRLIRPEQEGVLGPGAA